MRFGRSLLTGLALLPLVALTPEPSAVDGRMQVAPDIARLEFTPGKPKSVTIYPTGEGDGARGDTIQEGRLYWYLPYTLENKGEKEAKFFVTVRAKSEKGRRYSDLALPAVEKKVEKLEKKKLFSKTDLLENKERLGAYQVFPSGKKEECVAIFNPIDPEADIITIEVHGLVDDLEIKELPGGGYNVTERVLVLTYARPGDEFYTSLDAFEFKSREWTKRETQTPGR